MASRVTTTLASVARILAPGGHFFSSTICLKNLTGSLRTLGLATRVLPFLPEAGERSR